MVNSPARLHKVEETTMNKIERFFLNHARILLPLCIVLGLALFLIICYALCGISAVESGAMRNYMNGSGL